MSSSRLPARPMTFDLGLYTTVYNCACPAAMSTRMEGCDPGQAHLQGCGVPRGCPGQQGLPEGAIQVHRALQAFIGGPPHSRVCCRQHHAGWGAVVGGGEVTRPAGVPPKQLDLRTMARSWVLNGPCGIWVGWGARSRGLTFLDMQQIWWWCSVGHWGMQGQYVWPSPKLGPGMMACETVWTPLQQPDVSRKRCCCVLRGDSVTV